MTEQGRTARSRPSLLCLFAAFFLVVCVFHGSVSAQVAFNYLAAPTLVANTGQSEPLGEIVLSADGICGTAADGNCVSGAGQITITYTGMVIDNSLATGITVCERLSGVQTCNATGSYLAGPVFVGTSSQGGTVSFSVKAGADFAAADSVTVAGVRARIDQSALATPGQATDAIVTVAPNIAATFTPTTETVARSADPLNFFVVAGALVPCQPTDTAAVVEISEGFTTAFVDYADAAETSFPGLPLNARALFGATNSTRVVLSVSGLVPGIEIHWPASVAAVGGVSKLDLVSQTTNGGTATYVFSTPDQAASDVDIEVFDITLSSANFTFPGLSPFFGTASIQAQMAPGPLPATNRPRYNHPLEPATPVEFLGLRRCNTTVGTVQVKASVDGLPWSGTLRYHLEGPTPVDGSTVPVVLENMVAGQYTATWISGGPGGATFTGEITPGATQTLGVGGGVLFTFNFIGPTVATLHLSSTPAAVCPSASADVGRFQLINNTTDTQIIPGGTKFTLTFSHPITTPPAITGLGTVTSTISGNTMTFTLPASVSVIPGGSLTFSGTRLNLTTLGPANASVQVATSPAGAVVLDGTSATLATPESGCTTTPVFTPGGVTNGASFISGASAGAILTIFGSNLTNVTGIVNASTLPLPTELMGSSVLVNGVAAPLFSVANVAGQQQINFQMPWEVAGQSSVTIVVNNNGQMSAPVQVPLRAAHPGIFTSNTVFAAALHSDSVTPVTRNNPAAPNEVVVLYATGLGPVSANPGTGRAASANPLSLCVNNYTITVAQVEVPASFCGLAPGFVGLYQLNFRVPAGATPGDYTLAISGGDVLNQPILSIR